jgi:lipopolysaccharide/colanic/teichoic acid biosynthesis glycosyltransferase
MKNIQNLIKTLVDYTISIIGLVLLLPLLIILVIAIKAGSSGPALYAQKRVGKNGRTFNLYKFRSMKSGDGEGIPLLSDKSDERLTGTGKFMRKHKLDEIPNLINVLKGEMSLVGPRPEQEYFSNQILARRPEYSCLHFFKPGITSWGQVKYGYASNVDQMIERLDYDLYYANNWSLMFDMKIVLLTMRIIFRGQGV